MWFKNCLVYRFNKETQIDTDTLNDKLNAMSFKPCNSQEVEKFGWTALPQLDSMAHMTRDAILICAKKEEKLLPNSVIKDNLTKKTEQAETDKGRALTKKEKTDLKQEIVFELLPRAFSKYSHTFLMICPKEQLVVIDCPSSAKAEQLLSLLRKTLGSLPVVPAFADDNIATTLTQWVQANDAPSPLVMLNELTLKSLIDEGSVQCKNVELDSDEIQTHLKNDKMVHRLALNWDERIEFVLTEDGALKRLKFIDTLTDENEQIASDDKAARFDADFTLMSNEIIELILSLQNHLTIAEQHNQLELTAKAQTAAMV